MMKTESQAVKEEIEEIFEAEGINVSVGVNIHDQGGTQVLNFEIVTYVEDAEVTMNGKVRDYDFQDSLELLLQVDSAVSEFKTRVYDAYEYQRDSKPSLDGQITI